MRLQAMAGLKGLDWYLTWNLEPKPQRRAVLVVAF
jgi:hypothetical protein